MSTNSCVRVWTAAARRRAVIGTAAMDEGRAALGAENKGFSSELAISGSRRAIAVCAGARQPGAGPRRRFGARTRHFAVRNSDSTNGLSPLTRGRESDGSPGISEQRLGELGTGLSGGQQFRALVQGVLQLVAFGTRSNQAYVAFRLGGALRPPGHVPLADVHGAGGGQRIGFLSADPVNSEERQKLIRMYSH